MLGNLFMLSLSFAGIFSKFNFSKNSFRNTVRVSNSLDPDQDRHYVGPDLGHNCLPSLSTDEVTIAIGTKIVCFVICYSKK